MVIDEEFQNLIPVLTNEELKGLEASILSEGCRDALVCWGDVLVDGHNRYKICTEHNISFRTIQKEFANRNEVKLWIMKNQISRRNLTDFQRIEITHKCEDAVRAKARERQGRRNDLETSGQNFPEVEAQEAKRATDELGAMAGVSRKTYEHATTVLDKAPEPIVKATRNNELSINAAYKVTKMPKEQQNQITKRIENGEKPKDVVADVKKPFVSYNNGNSEWYTPADFIELARKVMGNIDLDPASTEIANKVVQADTFYTHEMNGLERSWFGNVWLNPPYASDAIGKFSDKLVKELGNISQALVLVNNATETDWFSKLVEKAQAVCFPKGRVKFYAPDGSLGAPLQGQAILYFGKKSDLFVDVFRCKGWCALLQ